MGQSPEELRYDIERTRAGMDNTLDHIEDRVSPGRIVERRKARMRDAVSGVRDRVMGTAHDVRAQGQAKADNAGSRLDDMGNQMSERVDHLQEAGKRQYRGNPLAAGLIAFGAGALLGSLLPETEPEHQVAENLQERLQPVAGELKSAGQQVAEDLKEDAQEAVEHTKETAADAAETVKEDARTSAQDVKEESRERAEHVQEQARR
jgi:gas vesicle protein